MFGSPNLNWGSGLANTLHTQVPQNMQIYKHDMNYSSKDLDIDVITAPRYLLNCIATELGNTPLHNYKREYLHKVQVLTQ